MSLVAMAQNPVAETGAEAVVVDSVPDGANPAEERLGL
jgi:hypothetical protein